MFWQSIIVAILVHFHVVHGAGQFTTANMSTGIQNALVCVEMMFLSIYHLWAFNVNEYKVHGLSPTKRWRSFLNVLNVADIWTDTLHSFATRNASGGEFSPLLTPRYDSNM